MKTNKIVESSGDGCVNSVYCIDTKDIKFIFVAETIYPYEETAPFDRSTNKRIKTKIELQHPEIMEWSEDAKTSHRKCLWSKVIETW